MNNNLYKIVKSRIIYKIFEIINSMIIRIIYLFKTLIITRKIIILNIKVMMTQKMI
jgi:hypothetical protein